MGPHGACDGDSVHERGRDSELVLAQRACAARLLETIAADAHAVTGTWSEPGAEISVVLTGQAPGIEPSTVAFDPPMDAVDIEKIQTVLDTDLAKLVETAFAPKTGVSA